MTVFWLLGAVMLVVVAAGVALALRFHFRTLYKAPWFLLVGPSDEGRTALVAGSVETAFPRKVRPPHADERDVAWHYFEGGVVIDVAGRIAFPPGGADLGAWQRLLHLLTGYRPRRPVDGVILAVPAPLLLGETWQLGMQDLGAAIRERLTLAQAHFGFALPVYVVITQSDRLRGFTAFARALPENLLQNMLGWSNPHAANLPYAGEWIGEGFSSLHRSLVHAQVELFASNARLEDASDVLLFSGEVGQLAAPLSALLEEVFRPSLYHDSYFLRGFYLCGEGTPQRIVADLQAGVAAPPFHAAPIRAVNFAGDLLDRKVFPELGLATPLPDLSVARRRGSVAGQAVCALLVIGLAAGTGWSYLRLRGVQGTYTQMLAIGSDQLAARRQVQRNERAQTDQERLEESRNFLERLQEMSQNRFRSVFMPASFVAPIEPAVANVVKNVFADAVLGDFRTALGHKGRQWLEAAGLQPGDSQGPEGPDLKTSPRYQALERFAKDYQAFVDNYRRYDRIARVEGAGDLSLPSELLAYLGSAPLGATFLAPTFARAVKAARSAPIACQVFEVDAQSRDSLVGRQASALLRDFGTRAFGDENPVLASAAGFDDAWTTISKGDGDTGTLTFLIEDAATLSQAVTAWAALAGRPDALRIPIPVLALPPFKQLAATSGFCAALRPDLSAVTAEVALLKDQLTARLRTIEVAPFGPLLEEGDKGLELNTEVAKLKAGLDDLARQSFWSPPPSEPTGVLPATPTWRPEAIDDVVKVFDAYDSYRGQAFGGLTVPERRELQSVIRTEVAQLLATRLALTAAPGAPPATADQITQLGAQLAKLGRLVPLLASYPPFGPQLVTALDQQARSALQEIDRTASTRYPSVFVRGNGQIFTAWANIQAAAPAADALKQWGVVVDDLREGTRQLALQAQPIAAYLTGRDSSDLVRRWAGIAADVASYDQKRPDNGLAALDAAMRDGVPSMAPDKDCSPLGTSPATGFFATIRNAIAEEGARRCRGVLEGRYATIATAFNRLLASRFPFSRALDGAPEATPAQAAEFLRAYDAQSGRALRQALEARSCSGDAVTFIRRMDTAYALMASVQAPAATGVALDVVPEFRVARDRDNGGDQIVQWQMDVGRLAFREPVAAAKPAPWTSGDPVSVTMRFARDSPNRPLTGAQFVRLEDRTVRFEFHGAWALFGLLRSGRAAAIDLPAPRDAAPAVLGFEIPVERDPKSPPLVAAEPRSPFKVYMRLRVFQTGKTDPLPVDDFPPEAPPRVSCPGS